MTRIVVATFSDAEAARRAAVALGRAELAAGPTRVQVDASSPERGARLELRVDEPDAPRAIALMREHGAAVADRDDGRDPRDGDPLAAWGMAVADAVTAAMGGATTGTPPPEVAAGRSPPSPTAVIWGNAPARGAAGTGSGTHLGDTVAAGTASNMGQVGPGSTIAAAMGATDATGTASGTRTRAARDTQARADDVPIRDPRPPRRRPKSDA